MFPIQFRLSNYKELSEKAIRDSAESLAVPNEAISSVVIASDSDQDYAASIRQCRGHAGGGTHSGGGAGKTVPYRHDDETVRSDVVYPASTLTALFCYSHDAPTYLLSRYAIHHEFGHVVDYHARSALSPPPIHGNERTVVDYAPYYGPILLSEFAACFLAGPVVTSRQFDAIAANSRGSIEDVAGQGQRFGNQLPWYILSQAVQVAGTAMGMRSGSRKPMVVRWTGIRDESERELALFSQELGGLKAMYPAWDTVTCIARLTDLCESFSKTLRC